MRTLLFAPLRAFFRHTSISAVALSFLTAPTLLALTPVASAVPSWAPLPGAPFGPGRHEDVFFLDASTGWVVNLSGEVHQTRDGGESWRLLYKSDSLRFRAVGFVDSLRGWAGTLYSEAPLYETFDGGRHWSKVAGLPASVHGICGLSVVGDSVAYAAGAYYKTSPLLKTTDRGATWTPIDMSARAKSMIDVRFFTRDSGFVAGGFASRDDAPLDSLRAVVLFTGDGGATWETRYRSDSLASWSWKLSFPNRRHGFASIERQGRSEGMIVKSVDGGRTWSERKFTAQSDLQGIGFADSARGWAGTHYASYVTEDGGESWKPFAFGAERDAVNRIRMLGPELGYALGSTVFKYSVRPPGAIAPRPSRDDRGEGAGKGGRGRGHALIAPAPAAFRGKAEIRYRLAAPAWVSLDVFDGRGRRPPGARPIRPVRMRAGEHAVVLDAAGLAPGPYLYRLRLGEEWFSGETRVVR